MIGDRSVGPGNPCFVIAEAGVNHNGDAALAIEMVDVAAEAGADALKLQTFVAERVAGPESPKAPYQVETTGGESQLEMLRALELTVEEQRRVAVRCAERGIVFLSTPFDEESVDIVAELGAPALKVASGELTNVPLLQRAARTGLPVILSTGMAYLEEVESAVDILRTAGAAELIVLHCTSAYPALPADVNLRAMATLARALAVPVGLSDHTDGTTVAAAAVALGAAVVEKHFTLDRSLPGPDHRASLEPRALHLLVQAVRDVEAALGDGVKQPADAERATRLAARRSIAAACDLAAGTVLTHDMLVVLRPGTGLAPGRLRDVTGRRLARGVRRGQPLHADDLA